MNVAPRNGRLNGRRSRLQNHEWLAAVCFAVSVIVLIAAPGDAAARWTFSVVVLGSCAGVAVGVRRYRPVRRFSWWCLLLAALAFFIGLSLRNHQSTLVFAPWLTPTVFLLAGYAITGVAVFGWLRDYSNYADRTPLIDAMLIGLGALLISWVVLISPILGQMVSPGTAIANGIFPAVDAGLLALAGYVAATTARHNVALRWLLVSLASTLVGDIVYSIAVSRGMTPPAEFLDTFLVLPFLGLALAALHPSMSTMILHEHSISLHGRHRVVLTLSICLVCAVVPFLGRSVSAVDLAVRSILLGSILFGTFTRSERALKAVRRSDHESRYRAAHDPLTGLPNRGALVDSLGIRNPYADTSLLFVDLDDFKIVNDSYGHRAGDELIVAAARRLDAAVRDEGTLYRYAGDEFIVLTQTAGVDTPALVRRLVNCMAEPFTLTTALVYITATVGVAHASSLADADALEELIRDADSAMYHAKALGPGSSATFDVCMRFEATTALEKVTALRGALSRNEFEVVYQPIVDTSTGATVTFEALVRWHRAGEVLGPDEFIPAAEASGLIDELGEWVLRTAVEDLAFLRHYERSDVAVSVNVSAIQLRNIMFPEMICAILAERSVPGSALSLEVTESALFDDPPAVASILRRCSALGVHVVLDDFGTGYSSLSRLHDTPIDVVKIDKSFVHGLGSDGASSTMISAINAMADVMGIPTVAEGVETQQQAVAVGRLGCTFAQGYFHGRPAPLSHWVAVTPR